MNARAPAVDVAPEVRAALTAGQLADVVSTPAHQSVTCTVCEKQLPAGAPEPLSVILRPGPVGGPDLVAQYTHRRCAPSGIYAQATEQPEQLSASYAGLLLPAAAVPARLLLEVKSFRAADQERDLATSRQQEDGFVRVTDALEAIDPPLARSWTLRRSDRDTLELLHRRESIHVLEDVRPRMPEGWFDAAGSSRRVVVVVGTVLGLERPDLAHLNSRLQLGECVAASVRYRSDRRR